MHWLLAILLLLIPATGSAEPFLTCDDDPSVTSYVMELDGVVYPDSPAVTGHAWIDMQAVPDGDHTVRLRAKNVWGTSDYSLPLVFTKRVPGVPTGKRLVDRTGAVVPGSTPMRSN